MYFLAEGNLSLPQKRRDLESAPEDNPSKIKKVPSTQSESETEISDHYLDDLERTLEEKFGPVRKFDNEIFIASPHDTML